MTRLYTKLVAINTGKVSTIKDFEVLNGLMSQAADTVEPSFLFEVTRKTKPAVQIKVSLFVVR